jgi:hypothetical protein
MKTQIMDKRYQEGDVVYALEAPDVKLKIRRYVDRIYYCTLVDEPLKKEKVYFDRELMERKMDKIKPD